MLINTDIAAPPMASLRAHMLLISQCLLIFCSNFASKEVQERLFQAS